MKLPGKLQNLLKRSDDSDEEDEEFEPEIPFSETPDGRMQSSDKNVRLDMVDELAENPGAESLALLTTYIGDSDEDIREAIIEATAEYDEEAIPALTEVLHGDSRIAREAAVKALALIGGDDIKAALLEALKDTSVWVREAAAEVLTRFADSDETVQAALGERAALEAAAAILPDESVVTLVEDDEPTVINPGEEIESPATRYKSITR